MADTLLTPRLTLEPLSLAHVDEAYEVFRAPENVTYWYAEAHQSPEETRTMITHNIANTWSPWWAIRRKDTAQMIGLVGFYIGGPVPGMGYILHRDHWRRGFGSEAVSAAVEYGFRHLDLNRAELWIHEANIASQKLAEKVGFRRRGQFYTPASDHLPAHETLVYGLRADDWAAQQPDHPFVMPREIPLTGIIPTIMTDHVLESVAFYRDKLGFYVNSVGEEHDPPRFAIVSRGEWRSERIQIRFRYQPQPNASSGWLNIEVGGQIDALYEEFRSRGVTIAEDITTRDYGMRDFAIRDNNGYRLVFSSPI
ncbi:MAG TPA: GNAT family N-acetyltransferase [Phototrophicaceae bacterium]|nr:GNAT family N-acetyltransferase [Phototrophicaceae bacterium]